MRNTKLLAWPMVLMLGLLSTGVAYAHWSQMLYISGSVATGELDWQINNFTILDPYSGPDPPPDYHCNDNFVGTPAFWPDPDGKNIGWIEGTLRDSDGDGDNDTLDLTLHNVYPCYFNSISVYPHNNGTIPLKIDSAIFSSDYDTETLRAIGYVALDLDGDGENDIEFSYGNHFGFQMEPCTLPDPEISFWIHVLQDAPQGETLSFTIEIVAVQYDNYVPP